MLGPELGCGYAATRVLYAARRRGCVAAGGARAAVGDAGDRVSQQRIASPVRTASAPVPRGTERGWLRRGPERRDRLSVGGGAKRSTAGTCSPTGSASSGRDCGGRRHSFGGGGKGGDFNDPDRLRGGGRSGQGWT